MTDFIQFAASYGLRIERLTADRWTRVPTDDKPRRKNGAYFFNGLMGVCQNWALMLEPAVWWPDKDAAPIDKRELARRAAAAKLRLREDREKAARKARAMMEETDVTLHAYLDKKGLGAHRGLVYRPDTDNLLIVPMYVDKRLVGCQTITVDGDKKFLHGQQCKGAEFIIKGGDMDVFCEGMATGLSVHAALRQQCTVHICFSASNLTLLAKQAGRGFVVADYDMVNKSGKRTGIEAAKATGLPVYIPEAEGDDFNDEWRRIGTFQASQILLAWIRKNV